MKNRRFTLALLILGALCIVNSNIGFAKHSDDKIKDFIDDAADSLKGAVDKLGEDFGAIQKRLEDWKDHIQDKFDSGPVTLVARNCS